VNLRKTAVIVLLLALVLVIVWGCGQKKKPDTSNAGTVGMPGSRNAGPRRWFTRSGYDSGSTWSWSSPTGNGHGHAWCWCRSTGGRALWPCSHRG